MGVDGDSLHKDPCPAAAVTPALPQTDDLQVRDRGPHERHPLRIGLSAGADGGPIDPEDWAGRLPQANGIAPRVRIGSTWVNLLWLIPLTVALLIIGIAVAKASSCCSTCRSTGPRTTGGSPTTGCSCSPTS